MWYNTQINAKPPRNYSSKLRNNFQSSLGKEIVNPRERLMNTQKRQKLKVGDKLKLHKEKGD